MGEGIGTLGHLDTPGGVKAGMEIQELRRNMVGPTARLVDFLRELARVGRPRACDVDQHPVARWLAGLPPEITLNNEAGPGDTLFSIDPVVSEPPPAPPTTVAPWLDLDAVGDSATVRPELAADVLKTDMPRRERSAIFDAYEAWVQKWQIWAEADRLVAPRRSWYQELARVARHLEQQDDLYELVIGTGLLSWKTIGPVRATGAPSDTGNDGNGQASGSHVAAGGQGADGDPAITAIRYPLLTTRVEVSAHPATGRIDVVIPDEATTRIGDRALLEGQTEFEAQRAEPVRDEVRSGPTAPLGDGNKDLLSRWRSLALSRAFQYDHTWEPTEVGERGPDLRFAPVLLLRERDRTNLVDYFDRMLEALSGPDVLAPLGLAQLLSALEPEDRLAWLRDEGAADGNVVGSDPLFPLSTNPEQRQVIDRLRHDNGVVVLGPPGTGKTHTIANLLSALLARGQRVLVTSQKAQALRVLREKLPPEIQKLCVSMTDVARGGSQELNQSVTALSDRYSTFSKVHHEGKVRTRTAARDSARQRVEELTERIRALRESETYVYPPVAPGYEGSKARIAERLSRYAPHHDWMPVPVPGAANLAPFTPAPESFDPAPPAPPLALDEGAELRRLLATSTPELVARTQQVLPDMATVPTAVTVRSLVNAEQAATTAAEDVATDLSQALSTVSVDDLAMLRSLVDQASAALHALSLGGDPSTWPDGWQTRAVHSAFARQELGMWHQLVQVATQARTAQDWLGSVGLQTVSLPAFEPVGSESLGGQLAAGRALRAHLAAGNTLKRRLQPVVQKQASRLLEGAFVDGAPITNRQLLDCVLATLEAEYAAAALTEQWRAVGVHVDSSLPLQRRVAQLVDLATALENVLAAGACRDGVEQRLATRNIRVPLVTPTEWAAFVQALGAVEARLEAERATTALDELVARLEIEAQSPAAAPEIARLAAATADRDPDSYDRHLQALAGAFAEQADQQRCDQLWDELHGAHPVLAEQLARTAGDPDWDSRLGSFDDAWAWGLARTFFDSLRESGLEDRLATDLRDAVGRVERMTAELAAEEAWGQCLLRMTAHQEQALRSYRSSIETRGKGTGKWAPRFAAAAREAMVEAREAVPAWIMPLRDIVETIPPDQNSFDVVVIDEASQASIESLFLLWLAPRVIVVGDDRQCAPSQVVRGQLQPIFDRLDDYLADVPEYLRLAFTPKSNLFSLLETRFGSVIRLREHFRCMPEIVGWSSGQFYADAPLVPLRQFGSDRLSPLQAVYVSDATTEGTTSRVRNLVEAEALVQNLVACLNDPAYADRTFGVIVLQGSGQVRLIEELLQQEVAPAEWEERRLRVGTPPDFQGDQRDVVFLSMVIADQRRAVTARDWQRRFNVAASRARDQMWLFHSVPLDLLSPIDLRRSLLGYMMAPPASMPGAPAGLEDLTWDSETRDPFESRFEQRVFLALRDRGFHVTPGVEVNGRRIDLVVTGAQGRLAVECDGDHWHDRRADQLADIHRELELSRAGWRFWRVRESELYLDQEAALASLWDTLEARGIEPHDVEPVGPSEPLDLGGTAIELEPSAPAEPWEAIALSEEEGFDGLEGGEPADPDI